MNIFSWHKLPTGSSPQILGSCWHPIDGKLYVIAKGLKESKLWLAIFDGNDLAWEEIPGFTAILNPTSACLWWNSVTNKMNLMMLDSDKKFWTTSIVPNSPSPPIPPGPQPIPPGAEILPWGLSSLDKIVSGSPGLKKIYVFQVPKGRTYSGARFYSYLPDSTFNYTFTPQPPYLWGGKAAYSGQCMYSSDVNLDLTYLTPKLPDGYIPSGNYIIEIEWVGSGPILILTGEF